MGLVERWNRMASRPRPMGPDALSLGGESFSFEGIQEREIVMSKLSVTMNRHAVVDFVIYGQETPVEVLFRQLFVAVKRIGKPVVGRAYRQPPRGVGAWPNYHDVVRWLDSLDDSEEKAEEVAFLFKLYNTALNRVRPEVLEALKSGRDGEHDLA